MENFIWTDVIQGSLCIHCSEPVKQKFVTLDGSSFVVRLNIIFEQGYRLFSGHDYLHILYLRRSPGMKLYGFIRIKVGGIMESAVIVDTESTYKVTLGCIN